MHIWADVLHVEDDGPNTWLKQGLVWKLREFQQFGLSNQCTADPRLKYTERLTGDTVPKIFKNKDLSKILEALTVSLCFMYRCSNNYV